MAALEHWKQRLLGKPPLLLLPTDRPRGSSAVGAPLYTAEFEVPAYLTTQLEAGGSGDAQQRLHNCLLAAFAVLLTRYSRQDDITVAGVLPGTAQDLPVRIDLSGEPTFQGLITRIAAGLEADRQHADAPLATLAAAGGAPLPSNSPAQAPSPHPLCQAAFALASAHGGEADAANGALRPFSFELALLICNKGGVLQCALGANEVLYQTSTVDRMARHFQILLESIAADPGLPIMQLNFIDASERETVLHTFNQTELEVPAPQAGATTHGLFEHWAAATPNAPALVYQDTTLSYQQLNMRANQLAHFLRGRGVGPEVSVGIMMERSLELMIAMLGVLKAGGNYVPMDPEYPADRLALMAEDSEAPVLLSQRHVQENATVPVASEVILVDAEWDRSIAHMATSNPESSATPSNLAYMIFTSGSTGRPKGTLLQHAGLVNYLYYLCSTHGLGAKDVFLQKTPISFDVSVRELFFPYSCGGCLVFAQPGGHRDTEYLAQLMARQRITCASFVPSQLEVFLQEVEQAACRELRHVFVSGEALPPTSVAKFIQVLPHAQLHNLYGPTEATVDVTDYDVRLHKGRATVPIGPPIANVHMYVLDAAKQPLPVGVPGELMISSLQLARGYLKRDDLTAEKFIANPYGGEDPRYARMYRTGDLARWLPDGVLEFLGRLDHQVKLRGFRIELGEVENALCNCPSVRQAVAVLCKDPQGTNHLVAYVTPADADIEEAVEDMKQNVPEYMVPESITRLEALPLLPNGKVNRRGLPEPKFGEVPKEEYIAPRSRVEERIQATWHEVFMLAPISVQSDFFLIGGNSLLAGKVISRVRRAFAVDLPFTTIFEQRTIADMAAHIHHLWNEARVDGAGTGHLKEEVRVLRMYSEKERWGGTPCSYSQEMLIFNNELDPFNPAHNESFWVPMRGKLDVSALYAATRYLCERHTILMSRFALTGAAGPMLRQLRGQKFKLPFSYISLKTLESVGLPEGSEHAESIAKSRHELAKAERSFAKGKGGQETGVMYMPPERAATMAETVDSLGTQLPSDCGGFQNRLKTFLSTAGDCARAGDRPPSSVPDGAEGSNVSGLQSFEVEGGPTSASSHTGLLTAPRFFSMTRGSTQKRLLHAQSELSTDADGEDENDTMKQAEAVVGRVKKALALHYLTCGMYSRLRSGGLYGILRSCTSTLTSCCCPARTWHDLMDTQSRLQSRTSGGVAVPELQSRTSRHSVGLRKLLTHLSSVNFRLNEPGLLKATLIKVAEDQHIFLLVMHHTVTDGWSTSVICRELSAAYNAFAQDRTPELPPMPIQYADFAGWQRKWLAAGNMKTQLKYWREKLSGAVPIWSFPLDMARPPVPTGAGRRVPCALAPSAVKALRKLATKANATMFMAILTAFEALLVRYTQQDDLIVGVPYAGRNRAETEGLIGAFLGAVALRSNLADGPSFNTLLARVRKLALSAFENADTPLHMVMVDVMGLGNMAGAAAPPLFQSMFFLHDSEWLEGFQLTGIRNDVPRRIEKNVARHDLTLELTMDNSKNEVVGHLEYRADLFEPATASRIVKHLEVLIDAIIAKPDTCIWELVFMTPEELQLVHKFTVIPAHAVPAHMSPDGLRPVVFDRHGHMLPPGIPGELALLPYDPVVHEQEYGPAPVIERPQPVSPRSPSKQDGAPNAFSQFGDAMGRGIRQLSSRTSRAFAELLPSTSTPTGQQRLGAPNDSKSGLRTAASSLPKGSPLANGNGHLARTGENGQEQDPLSSPFDNSDPSAGWPDGQKTPPRPPKSVGFVTPEPPKARSSLKLRPPGRRSTNPSVELSEVRSKLQESMDRAVASHTGRSAPHKPALTLASVSGAHRTGLIAKCDHDGIFTIIGSAANKLTLDGFNIQLEDIDRAIRAASPQVTCAAAVVLKNPAGERKLVAYVSPATADIFAIDLALRSSLPFHLIPALFAPISSFPLQQNGEVDRAALPLPDWSMKVPRSYLAPRNRLEMEVQLIWQAVLNKSDMISIDADFSELGGNMMHAVIANGIVREVLGARTPALKIFEDRTIANVAHRIRLARKAAKNNPDEALSLAELPFLQPGPEYASPRASASF